MELRAERSLLLSLAARPVYSRIQNSEEILQPLATFTEAQGYPPAVERASRLVGRLEGSVSCWCCFSVLRGLPSSPNDHQSSPLLSSVSLSLCSPASFSNSTVALNENASFA